MNASTILLVDDDEVLRQVLRRVLTRHGYVVVEAGGVAEALQRSTRAAPSLALIDLRLPDGDGVEVAQQLAQEIGRIPLILMTAYPLRLRDQPELSRGFTHVLTKPLNLDELRQAIDTSLGGSVVEPQPSGSVPPPSEPRPLGSGSEDRSLTVAAPKAPRRRRWMWMSMLGVALAGLAIAVPALGTPAIQRFLHSPAVPVAAPILESHARLLSGSEEMELPQDVAERLGVMSEPVQTDVTPRTLELAGSLAFNPNRLGRVQARFAGEVVALGTVNEHLSSEHPNQRSLRYGDVVSAGQVLAVVLSKDLGEKKSELVDALMRLWYDEAQLAKLEELVKQGGVPPVTVMNQRTVVGTDRNAVFRVGLTLQTWRVPQEDIDAVKQEAKRVYEKQSERDLEKESDWARVEVRAPFDGTIVEKNVSLRNIVSTDFDLFKVADLRKLGVVVHAYEEDLRSSSHRCRAASPGRCAPRPTRMVPLLKSDGVQMLGLIVDPTQHTDPVMGLVSNDDGSLRVGQFVKATVDLPAPPNVVSVPASAVVEDGDQSTVFVQPDSSKHRYVRRRVAVALRLRDSVYVRGDLSAKDRKKGLQEVKPGEFIVTEGVLELQSALEDLQARAKARK